MERIELYDRYINDQMNDKEREDFEVQLKEDKKFADDFKIYLFTVDGICREAQQDNLDFGLAMRYISKEQLGEIIGKTDTDSKAFATNSAETPEGPKPMKFRFKQWIWPAASIAAVIVIAYTIVFNIEKRSKYAVYDEIYASAQFDDTPSRGGAKPIDITKLNDKQLMDALPKMMKDYEDSQDNDELYMFGYQLAMAYVRLHQPQPAIEVVSNLIEHLQADDVYEPEVREMKLILNLLK